MKIPYGVRHDIEFSTPISIGQGSSQFLIPGPIHDINSVADDFFSDSPNSSDLATEELEHPTESDDILPGPSASIRPGLLYEITTVGQAQDPNGTRSVEGVIDPFRSGEKGGEKAEIGPHLGVSGQDDKSLWKATVGSNKNQDRISLDGCKTFYSADIHHPLYYVLDCLDPEQTSRVGRSQIDGEQQAKLRRDETGECAETDPSFEKASQVTFKMKVDCGETSEDVPRGRQLGRTARGNDVTAKLRLLQIIDQEVMEYLSSGGEVSNISTARELATLGISQDKNLWNAVGADVLSRRTSTKVELGRITTVSPVWIADFKDGNFWYLTDVTPKSVSEGKVHYWGTLVHGIPTEVQTHS